MGKFFGAIVGIFTVLLWILAGVMHLWTVYIVYQMYGVFMAIVSLGFPVISELVLGFMAFTDSGFNSPYMQGLILLPIGWIALYLLSLLAAVIESKTDKYQA
ncbi:hypothetical protein V7075_13535 [Neobacillus drentensis]|uniref:hypothetical protein n=1 Tax=Neobacillus drentensis TaxID=220684 RepID=UPI002FFE03C8